MKIRNDFVTNSSSTSFIFGNTDNSESVETVYRLIRVIVNEIVTLYKRVSLQIKDEEAYQKYINSNHYAKYLKYRLQLQKNEKYISVLGKEMKNSFLCGDYNDICALFREGTEAMERFNDILRCYTYKQYEEYGELYILDIRDEKDSNIEIMLGDIVSEYCDIERENLLHYTENVFKQNRKSFALKFIGPIFVYYSEDVDWLSLFEYTLAYFSTCSSHVHSYISE